MYQKDFSKHKQDCYIVFKEMFFIFFFLLILLFSFLILNKYIHTICNRSIARRVRVSLTPETVVTMHLYQINKASENLLLCLFNHDYQYKKRSTTLLIFCCKKKKNYNAVVSRQHFRFRLLLFLLFDVNFFCLFCFCETNFDVFTIFSELSGLKGNMLFMEIYIYQLKAQSFL